MMSWTQQQVAQDSLLVATLVPPREIVTVAWAVSLKMLDTPTFWDFLRLKGMPYDVARTQAAFTCLNSKQTDTGLPFQWLFFLDSDVLVPRFALTRLMSHRLPIVSGLYYQRFPTFDGVSANYLPCMFNEAVADGKTVKRPITDFVSGSLVEAAYVPGGCLLINRSVFERFLQAGVKRIFEWTMTADSEGLGRSEDFEFCARARALGYKCFVDTGIVCTHEAEGEITPRGLLPRI